MLAYFSLLRHILRNPRQFFEGDFDRLSTREALSFALLTAWIGAAFQFAWTRLLAGPNSSFFSEHLAMMQGFGDFEPSALMEWVFAGGMTLLNPFFTLYSLYLSGAVIFLVLAVYKGGAQDFSKALRILAYACAASIFLILPPGIGTLFAFFYSLSLATIGIRTVYQMSTGGSLFLALSPSLLMLSLLAFIMIIGALFGIIFLAGFIATLFSL